MPGDPSLIFNSLGGTVLTAGGSGANTLNGTLLTGPTTFHIVGTNSGNDKIVGFGKNDILVVDFKLYDSNNDGIVTFSKNGVLDMDGGPGPGTGDTPGGDTVKFVDGAVKGSTGIRYLGSDGEGHHVYAEASVRLAGFTEGTLALDNFSGDMLGAKDSFFFDTDLDVAWNNDTIAKFGAEDVLVTTSKIFDGNGDGKISFIDGTLDLNGADELGHGGQQNQGSPWGKISITDTNGDTVTKLDFDGVTTVAGVDYYTYSLVG